jgi:hypothetical protein
MFSLSISFGPTGTIWAFMFKDKERAEAAYYDARNFSDKSIGFTIEDDFGQDASFPRSGVNGSLLEDLDLIEAARIQRSLADERCKAKFLQAARSDSTIRAGMGNQMPIMQPMGGFPRN